MNTTDLAAIIELHAQYLCGEETGRRAVLRDADLSDAVLRDADLSDAVLRGADLSRAVLRGADLSRADLRHAVLRGAVLRGAVLRDADLSGADLSRAVLRGAVLRGAVLRHADLSGSTGVRSAAAWIRDNFATCDRGIIVYKRGNGRREYAQPATWRWEPGAVLREVANHDRTLDCACGVNFGTLTWCLAHYQTAELWRCLIPWEYLPDVCVPYNTDGKARCEYLELIELVEATARKEQRNETRPSTIS